MAAFGNVQTLKVGPADVFSCRFSPDSTLIAATCMDGGMKAYNCSSSKEVYKMNVQGASGPRVPVTCLRFRPQGGGEKVKNVALMACSDGTVVHLHLGSGKTLHTIEEAPNEVYAVDYNMDASRFASAGKDKAIRVYNDAGKGLDTTLSEASEECSGHANRIFSLRWAPDHPHTLYSGGWDTTIQMWDVREGRSVGSIYGPYLCGDSLDVHPTDPNTLLTGSYRGKDQIQFWDRRTLKCCRSFDMPEDAKQGGKKGEDSTTFMTEGGEVEGRVSGMEGDRQAHLYAARFSPNGKCIAVGGAHCDAGYLLDAEHGHVLGHVPSSKPIYSADFAPNGDQVCFAGGKGNIHILKRKGTK